MTTFLAYWLLTLWLRAGVLEPDGFYTTDCIRRVRVCGETTDRRSSR